MKKTTPRVSIILSSFNRPEIKRAVNSVLNQSISDWELIICDDASTNKEVVQYLDSLTDPRIKVLHGEYKTPEQKRDEVCTFSRLINDALDVAQGGFITYLVDDVEYLGSRCETLLRYLSNSPTTFAVWDHQDMVSQKDGEVVFVRKQKPTMDPFAIEVHHGQSFILRLTQGNFINHCSVMHRKTDLKWSENPMYWRSIDQQFWLRCAKSGLRFDFYPAIVGEVMYTADTDIGTMFAQGKDIVDIVKARS